jgi:ABC-type transport system involved in multi-copper enzyme maturation permease subunit
MQRLLGIEWAKIAPYRAFRVLVIIYLIGFILMPWSLEMVPFFRNLQQLFEFPNIWAFYYWGATWGTLLPVIIITTFTCTEYSNRTFRQHVIDGMSRTEVFQAKMLLMFGLALGVTFIFTVNGLIAGYSNTFMLEQGDVFRKAWYIPAYFLQILGIMAMAFFIANLIRRTGLSIFAFLAWIMFEGLARPLLKHVAKDKGIISEHLPLGSLWKHGINLEQIFEDPSLAFDTARLIPPGPPLEAMIWKVIWIAVFMGGSYLLIKKRDL